MKILSFDVGIINLAYCLFEITESKVSILEWDVIDISGSSVCTMCKKKAGFTDGNIVVCTKHKSSGFKKIPSASQLDVSTLCISLIKNLDTKPHFLECELVLVENQPSLKNPKMKSVASCIFNYFLIRGKIDKKSVEEVCYISASNKLKLAKEMKLSIEECKSKYQANKKLAKLCCEEYIKSFPLYLEKYANHKKQDDLADCFLQGFYYIKKNFKNPNLS